MPPPNVEPIPAAYLNPQSLQGSEAEPPQ